MAEEPSLPTLPPSLPSGDRRKRTRDTEAPPTHSSTSSDPAFFSSDDDPALDNYQSHGRRKRRYVGTWYDQYPASSDSAMGDEAAPTYPRPRRNRAPSQPQKREFRRQLDSGVWMGADGSLTDTDDSVDLEPAAARLSLPQPRAQPSLPVSPARSRFAAEEQVARDIIRSCVDNGTEDVDLSDLRLGSISEDALARISDISPIPNVTKDVAFEQRDPKIKVFLSNNYLRAFPVALLNVEHLTVLSLRGNCLVKIPPSIAELQNLETLSIAQNSLHYLPAELLKLLRKGSKLRDLHFQPNPFWVPRATSADNWGAEEYESRTFGHRPDIKIDSCWTGLTTQLRARTPVQFIDGAHRVYSRFSLPPTNSFLFACHTTTLEVEPFRELATPKELASEVRFHADTSKVINPKGAKSLFELALRACVTSSQADRIPAWLREDEGWPAHFAPAVERALDIHRSGGLRCSVCGRETLVPLAQWIEFRQIGRTTVSITPEGNEVQKFTGLGGESEGPVPFLNVGCSWRCMPAKVEAPMVKEGGLS
ncbi:hypothetical protein VTK56DRAFT_9489 [Thermocarpiscus australiensis]